MRREPAWVIQDIYVCFADGSTLPFNEGDPERKCIVTETEPPASVDAPYQIAVRKQTQEKVYDRVTIGSPARLSYAQLSAFAAAEWRCGRIYGNSR